jgi:hypothetical protein
MAIYAVGDGTLSPVSETSFGAEGMYERKHIQRLLRDHIEVLDDRLMVIAEEFGDWIDSSRRIDLLCLDGNANLVVVELKRTEDGGHMELQALRYAAMVSAMTFEQLVESHSRFRSSSQPDTDGAKTAILQFLGWEDVEEDQFCRDTRIILAAADFGKELTTAVLWLIDRGLDIRCVRLKPYRLTDGPMLLDIQQLIPLPETASFQTQIGVKRQAARQNRTERHEICRNWWTALLSRPGSESHRVIAPAPSQYLRWQFKSGFRFVYLVWENECGVELYIDGGSKEATLPKLQALEAHKVEVETTFGHQLTWEDMSWARGCRIKFTMPGGYRSDEADWGAIQTAQIDAMNRLMAALKPGLAELGATY